MYFDMGAFKTQLLWDSYLRAVAAVCHVLKTLKPGSIRQTAAAKETRGGVVRCAGQLFRLTRFRNILAVRVELNLICAVCRVMLVPLRPILVLQGFL